MVHVTYEGDNFSLYEGDGSGVAMLLDVLDQFYWCCWREQMEFYPDIGWEDVCYLVDSDGWDLFKSIQDMDTLMRVLPAMFARTHGPAAAQAFQFTPEHVAEAVERGFITFEPARLPLGAIH